MATWQFWRYYRASACNHAERDIVVASPSVRLSASKWFNIPSNFFRRSDRGIILVFWAHCRNKIPQGTPRGDVKYTDRKNIAIIAFYHRIRYEVGPWFLWSLIGSHRQPIDLCWFQWPRMTSKGGARLVSWKREKCRCNFKLFWHFWIKRFAFLSVALDLAHAKAGDAV